jgi:GIY-YIG catalytic domain
MNSGVYSIENTQTGEMYVGSSKNIRSRWCVHKQLLREGRHWCVGLQQAFINNTLAFRKLIVCAAEHKLLYEQQAIDALVPVYNSAPIAGSLKGVKHSRKSVDNMRVSHLKHAKPVISSFGERFESIRAAARYIGAGNSNLKRVVGKSGRTCGGREWRYAP